jgi:Transmembrane secretion effector
MTTTSTPRPGLRAPARVPDFRKLWLGQALSLLGDGFSYIAFSWITLTLTHSTLTLGYVLALQAIPRALLTLVGGSFADRLSARRMMALSSWARAVLMLGIAAAGLSGALAVWMLCVAAALFGAVDAFFQPARVSVLPSVVEPDLLTAANALLGAGTRISAVLGPAVGGIVVAVSNASIGFLVDGVCFAVCGLAVSRIRASRPVAGSAPAADSLGSRIREGLTYALSDPRIRTILVVDVAVTFCYAGPFTVGFATLAKQHLHGGSATMGILNGALAGGAMLGTLGGGALRRKPGVGLLVAALAGWLAVGMAVLGLAAGTATAALTVLAMGFAIGFQGVFGISWVQRNIPGSILSRVIALDMVLGYAAAPVSLVLCGALAQRSTALMFGSIAAVLGVTALGVLSSKPVREMR